MVITDNQLIHDKEGRKVLRTQVEMCALDKGMAPLGTGRKTTWHKVGVPELSNRDLQVSKLILSPLKKKKVIHRPPISTSTDLILKPYSL